MGKKLRSENIIETPDVFTCLYREYSKDLYRFIYSLVGNAEEAGDFTQDTFLKLHRQLQKNEEILKPKGWLFRVAANLCYNHLKRKKVFGAIIKQEAPRTEIAPGNIETDLVKEQEIRLLKQAMEKLPVRDRLILTLYKNGFSTAEIARIIQVKLNSVGKILARSVKKLSKIVNEGDTR